MNADGSEAIFTRRRFLQNSAKASALGFLLPVITAPPGKAQTDCSRGYGRGLYGVDCYPGKKLLKAVIEGDIRVEGFKAYLQGEGGRTYRIEASQDLGNWQTISVRTMPLDGSPQLVHDAAAAGTNYRFYRAVLE